MLSKSIIRRYLHEYNTETCRPQVTLTNRKAKLDFVRKLGLKKSGIKYFWTDETKMKLYQNDGYRGF